MGTSTPRACRNSTMYGTARAASSLLTVTRTIWLPARHRAATWRTVPSTSAVSVLVMDCTTTGCALPTGTPPTFTVTVRLRCMLCMCLSAAWLRLRHQSNLHALRPKSAARNVCVPNPAAVNCPAFPSRRASRVRDPSSIHLTHNDLPTSPAAVGRAPARPGVRRAPPRRRAGGHGGHRRGQPVHHSPYGWVRALRPHRRRHRRHRHGAHAGRRHRSAGAPADRLDDVHGGAGGAGARVATGPQRTRGCSLAPPPGRWARAAATWACTRCSFRS